ncbi:serine hydrolase domain-containing protein [Actinoplanes couchii]|uniref:Beta-lactamase-related domain-containing protein n=1 Tax=Actinoplanes couchii TaxID=403638 RepID=A0ABQ3XNY0_9ACTN|nr:serine hydrolase domain-containing protein [Actinoplanes couchii]MDR6319594.1 CubicO group peptidase (beta-lactamase class C family) [Actinoplanes couchii]GID60183.1 hypothetical protein Aco03nite_085870 [Actinoplanes couchii]
MSFEEQWRSLVDADRIPAIGVAVAGPDGEVWTDGDDLLFPACSISKHVAAFGTLRLVADGTLDLDTDVDTYLSSWTLPPGAGTVTLRQLLAHTAGLTENWYPGYAAGVPVPALGQVLRGLPPATTPEVRPELAPGAGFRYSGAHYSVLEQLLTDVTGTPFGALMAGLVLEPVGMADSSFDQRFPHQHRERAALGHQKGVPVPGGWHTQPELAAAGLWSTPADLVRLEREILRAVAGESALLPADLAAQMVTAQVPGGFGLGTELRDGCFGHSGQNTGYNCFSYVWPETGRAVAVMTGDEKWRETLLALIDLAGAPPADRRR